MKTCKYCAAILHDANENGMCRRCYFRVRNRLRRGVDPDAPFTPRIREVRHESIGVPRPPKTCRVCSIELPRMNRSGLCKKHYHEEYQRKKRIEKSGYSVASRSMFSRAQKFPGRYKPGPRYHYRCGACTTPYITNLPIPSSICPWCFQKGVAVPDKSQLSTEASINAEVELGQ